MRLMLTGPRLFASHLFTVKESDVVEHMKLFVCPALFLFIPPRVLVVEGDSDPPVEGLFQAFIAFAFIPQSKRRIN